MGNTLITRKSNVVDLGIKLTDKLSWNQHIKSAVSKSKQRLWLIIRTLGRAAPVPAKRSTYLALCRSVLEFGTVLWSPTQKSLIEACEHIQRRATHYITNNFRYDHALYINYKARLLKLNLLPLSYRRELYDLIFFLKSLNSSNGYNVHKHLRFNTGTRTRRQAHGLDLRLPLCVTERARQFFPNRLALLWNALPLSIRKKLRYMSDPNAIKSVLLPYFTKRLREIFDPEDTCTWMHVCKCNKCST